MLGMNNVVLPLREQARKPRSVRGASVATKLLTSTFQMFRLRQYEYSLDIARLKIYQADLLKYNCFDIQVHHLISLRQYSITLIVLIFNLTI